MQDSIFCRGFILFLSFSSDVVQNFNGAFRLLRKMNSSAKTRLTAASTLAPRWSDSMIHFLFSTSHVYWQPQDATQYFQSSPRLGCTSKTSFRTPSRNLYSMHAIGRIQRPQKNLWCGKSVSGHGTWVDVSALHSCTTCTCLLSLVHRLIQRAPCLDDNGSSR